LPSTKISKEVRPFSIETKKKRAKISQFKLLLPHILFSRLIKNFDRAKKNANVRASYSSPREFRFFIVNRNRVVSVSLSL